MPEIQVGRIYREIEFLAEGRERRLKVTGTSGDMANIVDQATGEDSAILSSRLLNTACFELVPE